MAVKEYTGLSEIRGPIVVVENVSGVRYDEVVELILENGEKRTGRVIIAGENVAIIQVFEGTEEMDIEGTRVRFLGKPLEVSLSPDLLGRTLDGLGKPRDNLGEIVPEKTVDINGSPINPSARDTRETSFRQVFPA
nr:hypothetical protein [Thermotoga neapolitana]